MTRWEQIRLGALGTILVLVVLVGLPLGPLWALNDLAQRTTELIGIDVSMTPITVDMPGLIDGDGTPLYAEDVGVHPVVAGTMGARVELDALPFHRFRIPAVLFIEQQVHGVDVPELRVAMCRTLVEWVGDPRIESFVFLTPRDPSLGQRFGLNRAIPCTPGRNR